ncbi:MAG TPA: glycosyltransferase [Acidimicrobiales bacterium]|nr:glycosyltransferase [Acidimicrobiales bacterium]
MRVLAVTNLYPPHHVGGYEIACRGVMERFHRAGHEVMVLTAGTRVPGVADDARPETVTVRRRLDGWWDWERFAPARPGLLRRVAVERTNQRAVLDAVRDFRPDVASIWNLGYVSYAIATRLEELGVPIVVNLGDDWICYAHEFDAWTTMFERRPWARPAGAALGLRTRLPRFDTATVTMASALIADRVDARCPWRFGRRALVPLGVETWDFPVTVPADRPWSWRLLYVGRILPIKGVHTLVRALALLPPEARLEIDGHGPDHEVQALRALAEEVGVGARLRITRSRRGELRDRYRSADVVVFPSEWEEPFGIVPLEAMACGVPLVASGTGGSGEFLADGVNCVLFRPGDPGTLAAALHRIADDPALRRRVVLGGTDTAGHMTMDECARRLAVLHAEAAAGAGGPAPQTAARDTPRPEARPLVPPIGPSR